MIQREIEFELAMQRCFVESLKLKDNSQVRPANLSGANLSGADLFYANLSDANLSYAEFV